MTTEQSRAPAPLPTPDPILQLAMGFMAAKHLFVANAIGLFEHLADGPSTLDQVAARSGVSVRIVRILADAMVALRLLERDGDRYTNAVLAATYLSGRGPADLRPLLRFWDRISYPGWAQLELAVRSGQPQTRHGHFGEEEQRIFSEGVQALTAGPAHALPEAYDFSPHARVLDLGGGTGSFLLSVLRRYPGRGGTLFDLPNVAPVARQQLDQDPLGQQVDVVSGDFFRDPLPVGHDAVIVANVVHLFSPERNRDLLGRIRHAVQPGARLLLVDFWTDPSHTQPAAAALLAAEFLVIAGEGDVYSADELRGWLGACGWRPIDHRPLAGPASLVVAEAS